MNGFSAVATASVDSAERSQPAWLGSMPSTSFSRIASDVVVSRWIDCSRLRAMSGMRTLSSKLPCEPAIVIAMSLPTTWQPTCSATSGMTGLTLPGMIDEPFCSSGRKSSPRPARGPEPIHARSLAIFVSETATTLSIPDSSTSASRLPWASNGSSGALISRPVFWLSWDRTRSANSAWVFSPVPVAVPPSGIWPTWGSALRTRRAPRRSWAAYPANSWPSVTGTASIRWVRPDLTTSVNASALACSDASSASSAGISRFVASSSAARCTALGKTSFDDWPMLTWSLGWAPSPARFAMTSLAFMFDDVPEPVWKTSIGNCSSCSPAATCSAADAMRSARSLSSSPSSPLTRAAAPLIWPSQRTTATGTRSPEIGKLSTAFVVSPPQSCSVVAMSVTACSQGFAPVVRSWLTI
jgi:hypothetical protein